MLSEGLDFRSLRASFRIRKTRKVSAWRGRSSEAPVSDTVTNCSFTVRLVPTLVTTLLGRS